MSFTGILLTLVIAGFVVATALKIVPHYMDFWTLEKIVQSTYSEPSGTIVTVNDFYSHVSRGMQVNSIRDLDLKKVLSVTPDGPAFKAHLNYEKREPLIKNIDVVVKFDREFSVSKP